MWIYAFGSFVRGEIDPESDVDILCICSNKEKINIPSSVQIYSIEDYLSIHKKGDLFAHHLYKESRIIHTTNGKNIIQSLGNPGPYLAWNGDMKLFVEVARYSVKKVNDVKQSVFSKGTLYMSLRDMAMIYSHIQMGISDFSKYVPYNINVPIDIDREVYQILKQCRTSSTRGTWDSKNLDDLNTVHIERIDLWINKMEMWRKNYVEEN